MASSSSHINTAVSSASSSMVTNKSISSIGADASSSVSAEALVSSSSSNSSSTPTGAIVGGVAAVIVVAAVGSAALLFVRRKRRRELKKSRAANMTARAEPISENYITEAKGYTDYQEPQMEQDYYETEGYNNPEMIQQQQQQYYQSQSPIAVQQQLPNAIPVATAAAAAATTATATAAPEIIVPIVPLVAATNQEATPTSLGTYTVIATYIPTLSDELEIEPGDVIELLTEYDDGWCQGINVSRGNAKGVFPRHCIDHANVPTNNIPNLEKERTKRVSSMYVMGTR
ncbi:hypothetical protein G6F56_010715 [Rhizopus delemar]|nr:hypothetical protein G6F56_010715 [Rhizopus delemar]